MNLLTHLYRFFVLCPYEFELFHATMVMYYPFPKSLKYTIFVYPSDIVIELVLYEVTRP